MSSTPGGFDSPRASISLQIAGSLAYSFFNAAVDNRANNSCRDPGFSTVTPVSEMTVPTAREITRRRLAAKWAWFSSFAGAGASMAWMVVVMSAGVMAHRSMRVVSGHNPIRRGSTPRRLIIATNTGRWPCPRRSRRTPPTAAPCASADTGPSRSNTATTPAV